DESRTGVRTREPEVPVAGQRLGVNYAGDQQSPDQRQQYVKNFAVIQGEAASLLQGFPGLDVDQNEEQSEHENDSKLDAKFADVFPENVEGLLQSGHGCSPLRPQPAMSAPESRKWSAAALDSLR